VPRATRTPRNVGRCPSFEGHFLAPRVKPSRHDSQLVHRSVNGAAGKTALLPVSVYSSYYIDPTFCVISPNYWKSCRAARRSAPRRASGRRRSSSAHGSRRAREL
jgi:hypothetical protein